MRKLFQKLGVLTLVFVSILWLGLALHFLFLSAGPGVSSPLGEIIGAWLQLPCLKPADPQAIYVLGCLEANEAGDYLAGFFAPLAFLWLAAAVFIQSRELREQRRELVLTRREFELNREVAAEQAEAARSQAEAARKAADMAAEQTLIDKDEFQQRLFYRASEMFNFKRQAAEHALRKARLDVSHVAPIGCTYLDLFDPEPWLSEGRLAIEIKSKFTPPSGWPKYEAAVEAIAAVWEPLRQAFEYYERLSEVDRERNKLGLQGLRARVEKAESDLAELVAQGWWSEDGVGLNQDNPN